MYNSRLIFSNFFSEHRQGRGIQDDKPVRGPLLHHIVQYVSSGHCTLGFHMGKPPSRPNKAHWGIVKERAGTLPSNQRKEPLAEIKQFTHVLYAPKEGFCLRLLVTTTLTAVIEVTNGKRKGKVVHRSFP